MLNSQTSKTEYIPVAEADPSISIEYCEVDEESNLQDSLFTPFKQKLDYKGKGNKYKSSVPKNEHGNTRIHLAAKYGNANRLDDYLKELDNFDGVQRSFILLDISDENNSGKTPLHLAAERQHWKCLEVLLKETSQFINIKDDQKNTLLNILVSYPKIPSEEDAYYNIVEELLNMSCINAEMEDNTGKNACDYVKATKDDKLINLFTQYYDRRKNKAKSKYEKSYKIAEQSENLSKNFNKAAIVCGGITGFFIMGHIMFSAHLLGFIHFIVSENVKYITGTVSDHGAALSSILPPTALLAQHRSLKHKEKLDKLDDSIELYKARIEELQNALKDIRHIQTIARLEENNNKALLETKNQLEKELSEVKGQLSQAVSRLGSLSNIEMKELSSSRRSSFSKTMYDNAIDRKNSLQVTTCIQNQNLSEESITSTSLSIHSEEKEDFRSRSASCGAYFKKVQKEKNENAPQTFLHSARSSSVKNTRYSRCD